MPRVDLYDMPTGQLLGSIHCRTKKPVHVLAFGSDGNTLAIAGEIQVLGPFEPEPPWGNHGYLELWDVSRRGCLAQTRIREKGAPVLAIAFSPDGKKVATGDLTGNIRIWAVPEEL